MISPIEVNLAVCPDKYGVAGQRHVAVVAPGERVGSRSWTRAGKRYSSRCRDLHTVACGRIIPRAIVRFDCIDVGSARADGGIGPYQRRPWNGPDNRAIARDLVAGNADVIGAGIPANIHFG